MAAMLLLPPNVLFYFSISDFRKFKSILYEWMCTHARTKLVRYVQTYTMSIVRVWNDSLKVMKCYTTLQWVPLWKNEHRKCLRFTVGFCGGAGKTEKTTRGKPEPSPASKHGQSHCRAARLHTSGLRMNRVSPSWPPKASLFSWTVNCRADILLDEIIFRLSRPGR